MDLQNEVRLLCENAKRASRSISLADENKKNKLLLRIAELLVENQEPIIKANAEDLARAEENGVAKAMLDRLMINEVRIKGIADSLCNVAALDDPIGKGDVWSRPSGITLRRIRVPLGVVGIIYEARPNVTVENLIHTVTQEYTSNTPTRQNQATGLWEDVSGEGFSRFEVIISSLSKFLSEKLKRFVLLMKI